MKIALYALILAVLWFVLSGHTGVLMLSLGALSVGVVVATANRMRLIDNEGFPIQVLPGFARYAVWLTRRIIESNLAVARLILDPRLPIVPNEIRLTSAARSDVARVCYANSITREAAEQLEAGDMDREVARLERRA